MQPFMPKIKAMTASYDAMVLSLHSEVEVQMRTNFNSNILTAKDLEAQDHVNRNSKESDFCLAQ